MCDVRNCFYWIAGRGLNRDYQIRETKVVLSASVSTLHHLRKRESKMTKLLHTEVGPFFLAVGDVIRA